MILPPSFKENPDIFNELAERLVYQGPVCGTSDSIIDIDDRSSPPFGQLVRDGTPLNQFCWQGQPYSALPRRPNDEAFSGDRFDDPCKDDCKDRIEMFCKNNSNFRYYYVDCRENWYFIGECEWGVANNILSTTKTTCTLTGTEEKFSSIRLENLEGVEDEEGNFVPTGNKNTYTFDTCIKLLTRKRIGPGADTSGVGFEPPLLPPQQ